jgi:aminoglycoside phosphotransferase (APT) family kinase protein
VDIDADDFLGRYGLSAQRSQRLHRDAEAIVLRVDTNQGPIVLKVKHEADRPIIEAETTRRLHLAGLPVEPLIGHGSEPMPHVVRRWLPGTSLNSRSARSAQHEAGALLRSIHDLGGGPPYAGKESWDDWMHGWLNYALGWWRDAGHGDKSRIDAAWTWFGNIRPILASRGHHFILFDGRPEHFLVNDGAIRGIVDLETARSGDGGMDLGVMAVSDPDLLREVLVGYDADATESAVLHELVPFYVFLRRLAAVEWNLGRGNVATAAAVLSLLNSTGIPA